MFCQNRRHAYSLSVSRRANSRLTQTEAMHLESLLWPSTVVRQGPPERSVKSEPLCRHSPQLPRTQSFRGLSKHFRTSRSFVPKSCLRLSRQRFWASAQASDSYSNQAVNNRQPQATPLSPQNQQRCGSYLLLSAKLHTPSVPCSMPSNLLCLQSPPVMEVRLHGFTTME